MEIDGFTETLSANLKEIPGMENDIDYLNAAILLPLINTPEGLSILFEVRAAKLAWQPGEICFPGGRIEKTDLNPMATAVRETCEELNISKEKINVLGALNYLITPIGVFLHPYVGVLSSDTEIIPNADEVEEVFTVPLHYLQKTQPITSQIEIATQPFADFPFPLVPNYQKDWKVRTSYQVFFYQYKEYVIWGLTARVLNSFLKLCPDIE